MKILLLAVSAREHAVAAAFARSRHAPDIIAICPSANPGLQDLCSELIVGSITDANLLRSTAQRIKPDLAFIGPEDPLGAGMADLLWQMGVPTVGPKQALAQIESSKAFTRDLLEHDVQGVSPLFRTFTAADEQEIPAYIDSLKGNVVVKYDGLKGGKGVKVSGEHLHSNEESIAYALECIAEGGKVVIEEKLVGVEFSLLSFVSGKQIAHMPVVQDHKRAFEGDTGNNTGGMGTYTDANGSLPFLSERDVSRAQEINSRVAEALLKRTGMPYQGILYGGYMAVKDDVKVIEFNARLGDPEALNLLTLLESDFVDICMAITTGTLTPNLVQFAPQASVCKYIVPKSYPDAKSEKDQPVVFPPPSNGVSLYFGDCSTAGSQILLGGSRTAGVVATGNSISEAEAACEAYCQTIQGPVRHRKDVGTAKLIAKRAEVLESIRK